MKHSEPILLRYLRDQGVEVFHERLLGSVRPDFSTWSADDQPIACWEMADRELQPEDISESERVIAEFRAGATMVASEFTADSLGFVRYKIMKKSEQVSKVGAVPTMLVLADWAHCVNLSARMIAYAWPERRPSRIVLPPGTERIDEHEQRRNSISAVAALRHERVNYHVSGLRDFQGRLYDKFGLTEHALALGAAFESELHHGGLDLGFETPVLDIVLNPLAHLPWPMHLVGEFDRVYTFDPKSRAVTCNRDGLAPRTNREIPMSQDQRDIDSLLGDPMLRTDLFN